MTDRHLFTAAEGKHAGGIRKNYAVVMPAGRKTNETHCSNMGLGHVNIRGHWCPYEMIYDDYDGQ